MIDTGNIKPTYIKVMARNLLNEIHTFSEDFEENKRIIEKVTNIDSKTVRNRVAGYITRIIRREKRGIEK